ncbi:hypothetical protein OAL71_01445 [Phycisphaerales bacterium]|nr:hypothetical protein [Phycisphaerales bacterium]
MTSSPSILAGLDVHGIQNYVFRGSRLKEIVGGSHLVDKFTAEIPERVAQDLGLREATHGEVDSPGTWLPLRTAGGRIRASFHDREAAHAWMQGVTLAICKHAPNLPFTGSLVEIGAQGLPEAHTELHSRLEAKRRSAGSESYFRGFPFTAPCRTTGDAASAYGRRNNERLSEEMVAKQNAATDAGESLLIDIRTAVEHHTVLGDAMHDLGLESPLRWPLDIEDMLADRRGHLGAYMGVVRFDGNSIGERIREVLSRSSTAADHSSGFKKFCRCMAECTRHAIVDSVVEMLFHLHREGSLPRCRRKLPVRVLLEGGDDVTALVRPDLAIPFSRALLENFEKRTAESPAVGALKAAVGIAIVKSKAPVLAGVDLAGSLLEEAKEAGRDSSRASFYLASGGIPIDLVRDRSLHFESKDRLALTAWPRTIAEIDELLSRATFICSDLPRSHVRGAADECRSGIDAAGLAFDKMRDSVDRDLERRGDSAALVETLDRAWPDGWFQSKDGRQATDLLDCLDLGRFIPERTGARA